MPIKESVNLAPYQSAQQKKEKQKKGKKLSQVNSITGVQAASKQFLKKDHHDTNMVVAVRIRPLHSREIQNKDFDIIQTQDKLIVSQDSPYDKTIDCAG